MTQLSQGGLESASIEVIYNGDALKQSFVRSTVNSKLAEADAALARQITQVAGGYIDTIANGGEIDLGGLHFDLIGLRKANNLLVSATRLAGDDKALRDKIKPVQNFAALGVANIDRFKDVLSTVERPVQVAGDDPQRAAHAAGHVRRRARGGGVAHVRLRPAGVRACSRSSARRTRSRGWPAASSPAGCCSPARSCSPPAAPSS